MPHCRHHALLLLLAAWGAGGAAAAASSSGAPAGPQREEARVSGNTVSLGDVRITVHSDSMLRAEWSASGAFEDRPSVSWLNRSVSAPFTHSAEAGALVVRTAKVELRYDPHTAPAPPPTGRLGPAAPRFQFSQPSGITWAGKLRRRRARSEEGVQGKRVNNKLCV